MIITINDDFDLYKIAYSGQCFRVKEIAKNTFRFITGEHVVTISADYSDYSDYPIPSGSSGSALSYSSASLGSLGSAFSYDSATSSPVRLTASCSRKEWDLIWHDYFDLDTCYLDIRNSIPKDDEYLLRAAALGRGIRILKQDYFEMLISFIISQRKSIPAIKKCIEMLCTEFGEALSGYDDLYRFPTAQELCAASEDKLRSCGLGYRLPYVSKACERILHNEINLESLNNLPDEELVATLKTFYGVGDKVANCAALFAYHRTSLAPVDTWIKKIIDTKYSGINPFGNYGNYAGIMQQYMFYAAQHLNKL